MSSPQEFFRTVPRATEAVQAAPASGLAYWRQAWSRRHTAFALAASALIFPVNAGVAGWPAQAGVLLTLGLLSVLGGFVVASYLPSKDVKATSPCAAGPLLITVAATILLSREPVTLVGALLSALLLLPALALRAFGPTSCAA